MKFKKPGITCRCYICGKKNANSNQVRNSYVRVGICRDEDGFFSGRMSKKESRKLRRTREKRNDQMEEE